MGILRLVGIGATAYSLYRYVKRPRPVAAGTRNHDGLAAIFRTRGEADLAVEHLVQEYHVDRAAIFAEPVEDENSAGIAISGGDAPSGDEGSKARKDAPLNGAIRVTVATGQRDEAVLRKSLRDAGAVDVQAL